MSFSSSCNFCFVIYSVILVTQLALLKIAIKRIRSLLVYTSQIMIKRIYNFDKHFIIQFWFQLINSVTVNVKQLFIFVEINEILRVL